MLKMKVHLIAFSLVIICMGVMLSFFFRKDKKVTISYGDAILSFSTNRATVKEAIKEAGISIKEEDFVKPPLDSPLQKDTFIKILKGKSVFLVVDGRAIKTITCKNSVREFLHELSIKLAKEDIVKPSPATRLKDEGYNYICIRMARKITITVADRQPKTIKSTRRYIYQLLSDYGVALNSEDRVCPVPQTPLVDGMKINVTKVKHRVYAEREVIPYRVIYRDDPTIAEGDEVVAQEGQVGIIKKTRKIYYKNHEISSENIIKKELICEPVNKIVLVGTKVEPSYIPPSPPPVELASHGSLKSGSCITMEATAYEPSTKSCGPCASGYTATGLPARYGVVAVDPYVIPLGSHLYVEGYGYAIAADKGTAITGNRIDLCFDTYEDAINYGRRTVKVYLLK